MGARRGRALVIALVALTACSSSGGSPPTPVDRTVDVYEGIVRWTIGGLPSPPTTGVEKLPIVYVIAVDGDPIAADSQVEIVRDLKDDATVRFADQRDEAIDDGVEGEPVRDGGILVLVGPVEDGTVPVDVDITLYRTASDERPMRLRLERRGEDWVVATATAT